MTTRDWIEIILSVLGGIGMLFLGLGYAYSQFKEGSNKNKLDTISLLREDVDTLTAEVKKLTDKVKDLTVEKEEMDKRFSEWKAIFEGRDPATKLFMDAMTKHMSDEQTIVFPVVTRLDKYLNGQQF